MATALQSNSRLDFVATSQRSPQEVCAAVFECVTREVRGRLGRDAAEQCDVEEVVSEAVAKTLAALSDPDREDVENVYAFARVVARRQVSAYLAGRNPRRARVAAQIRASARTPGSPILIWTCPASGARMVGLRKDAGSGSVADPNRLAWALSDPTVVAPPAGCGVDRLVRTVEAAFGWLGGPVGFQALVSIVAGALGEVDHRAEALTDELPNGSATTPYRRSELRAFLREMWEAITRLKPEHRTALLLNVRDADGVGDVRLIVELGIADRAEVCATAGIEESEWESLPLTDADIAVRLRTNPAAVFGYRSSARRRLAQSMSRRGW